MKRLIVLVAFVLLLSSVISAQDDSITTRNTAPDPTAVELVEVYDDLRRPLFMTHADDGSGRAFIVEQGGIIHVYHAEGARSTFLDVSDLVSVAANQNVYTERGLLGLAFHPDYAENGTFFINYTNRAGATVIARYQVSDDPNVADAESGAIIFMLTQPFPNHNGGHMAFGPDGYLYVSVGDGGAAGDPLNAGQNPQTLLGTIMRVDVNSDDGYAIPDDNPFIDGVAGAPEVWSYGWRNPWRFSFDRATGDMYIGDVGQNQWEEINYEAADSAGGLNYGWKAFEATRIYDSNISAPSAVQPIAEYNHSEGCSVTGGYVYRGAAIPDLQGAYLYSDYCTGRIWYAYRNASGAWVSDVFFDADMQVSSFGEDEDGELYLVNYRGSVHQLVPAQQ